MPAVATHAWETPKAFWSRVHIGFVGPFHGQTFFVVANAYSKWLGVVLFSSTTLEAVIWTLRKLFPIHGLPDILVSDNEAKFTYVLFEIFLSNLHSKWPLICKELHWRQLLDSSSCCLHVGFIVLQGLLDDGRLRSHHIDQLCSHLVLKSLWLCLIAREGPSLPNLFKWICTL